ncbi:MAG: hypothetical protein ACNA7V_09410 [Bacteroidales bacterium]
METIRYTGEDIAIDIELKNDDGTIIDPSAIPAITVYLVDQGGAVAAMYAQPEREGYEPLIVDDAKIRLWLQSPLTKTLANKKLHIELNLQEAAPELDDGKQNTIALSDQIIIKHALVGAESEPVIPAP